MHFKDDFADRLALQKQSIALAKKQLNADDVTIDDSGDAWMPNSGYQQDEEERDVAVVPLPLALQGPGAVAWQLLQDASCTEEQIDAVALLACWHGRLRRCGLYVCTCTDCTAVQYRVLVIRYCCSVCTVRYRGYENAC